jgi:hypothetical protein
MKRVIAASNLSAQSSSVAWVIPASTPWPMHDDLELHPMPHGKQIGPAGDNPESALWLSLSRAC